MCDCVALSPVQLLEYVERLKDLAAISPSALAFDEKSVNELLLNTPRIVQEALIEEARHCGRTHVKYPARCECLVMSALNRNPSAMLQGNLRRMKACHEADRGLDARRVVPAVWVSRVCDCCCLAQCSRELHRLEEIGGRQRGQVFLDELVPWVSGVSLIAVLSRPRMLDQRRRFAWTTARTALRMSLTRMASLRLCRISCRALPYARLSRLRGLCLLRPTSSLTLRCLFALRLVQLRRLSLVLRPCLHRGRPRQLLEFLWLWLVLLRSLARRISSRFSVGFSSVLGLQCRRLDLMLCSSVAVPGQVPGRGEAVEAIVEDFQHRYRATVRRYVPGYGEVSSMEDERLGAFAEVVLGPQGRQDLERRGHEDADDLGPCGRILGDYRWLVQAVGREIMGLARSLRVRQFCCVSPLHVRIG